MKCFTSATLNYLPKARVWAESVIRHHPDWEPFLVLSEPIPEGLIDPIKEPFHEILTIQQLQVKDLYAWIFKHRLVEICTAVKGSAALYLMDQRDADRLIYFDPDTVIFNRLDPLEEFLLEYPILLTPHQITPDREVEAIVDNEVCSLKHGVFNMGFFAVKNEEQGRKFIEWYNDRLLQFCYDDIPNGLFTDQKWCDLAPAFFDRLFVLRDPGYNVASWNLTRRKLEYGPDGNILVNSEPLRFYHFTGYDSGEGSIMVSKYGKGNEIVHDLWNWYESELWYHGQEEFGSWAWKYDTFDNGEPILDEMRFLYRERQDLQDYFPDPFSTKREDGGYLAWWKASRSRKK